MKFRKITVFLCLTLFLTFSFKVVPVHAALIEAVYGTTPTIDGTVSVPEWADATTTTFTGPSGLCAVFVKHDVSNLYIGVNIEDNTEDSSDYLEVFLDTNHDEAPLPQTDDYYLFIDRPVFGSSVTYEYQGSGFNWVYIGSAIGWTSAATHTPNYWQVELSISYTKLGITPGVAKQMGIEFIVLDAPVGSFYYWTAGATFSSPISWGDIASTSDSWVPWFTSLPIVLLISIPLVIFLRKKSHSLQNTV